MSVVAGQPSSSVDGTSPSTINSAGGESTMTALFETICVSSAQVIDSILNENPEVIHFKGWHGLSLLHRVCMRGDPDAIAVVLRHGADPNGATDGGETPLHYSGRHGRMAPCATLIRGGADPNALDRAGHGCLHFAAQGGCVTFMAYLNEVHGAVYDRLSEAKQTPLHVASIHGHWQTVAFLLRKERCSVTQKDVMGNTPLHLAACYGHIAVCWQILASSRKSMALLSSVNDHNETPLDLAKMGNSARHKETQKWLSHFGQSRGNLSPPRQTQYFNFFMPSALCCLPLVIAPFLRIPSGFQPLMYGLILVFLGYWIVRQDHRLSHPSRLPNPARAGIFFLGIVGNLVSYFLILKPYVKVDWLMNWASWTILFVFILAIVSFFAKERGRYRYETTSNSDGGRDWSRICNGTLGANFCDECELIQADCVRHCRMCGVCYYDLQHHCLFLLRCITSSNARHFLFLLVTVIIGCIFYILNVIVCLTNETPLQQSLIGNENQSDEKPSVASVISKSGNLTNGSVGMSTGEPRNTFWQLMTEQTFVLVVFVLDVLGIIWCSVLAHHQATDPKNWPRSTSSLLNRGTPHHHVKVMGV